MSTPEDTPSTGNVAKRRVSDDDNQSQNATIRRIQSFRDDIAEYQLLFAQNELQNDISEAQQHRSYHQLARGFLQLLKPYLMDEEIPRSEYYWNEVELGEFTISPPEVIQQPSQGQMEAALKAGRRETLARADPRNSVESKHYSVVGLRDFAAADPEWEVEWQVMYGPDVRPSGIRSQIRDSSVRVHPRSHRNEPITVTKTVRVPRQIIDAAITELEQFVREVGMDIDLDDSVPEWGFKEVHEDVED